MFPPYLHHHPHHCDHKPLLLVHQPQVAEAEEEVEEVAEEVAEKVAEAEEAVEEQEDNQPPLQLPTSDSAETLQKYSQETEKKQTASSPNSNTTTWPILEFQTLIHGSEKLSSPALTSKDPLSVNGSTEQWTGSRDWIL